MKPVALLAITVLLCPPPLWAVPADALRPAGLEEANQEIKDDFVQALGYRRAAAQRVTRPITVIAGFRGATAGLEEPRERDSFHHLIRAAGDHLYRRIQLAQRQGRPDGALRFTLEAFEAAFSGIQTYDEFLDTCASFDRATAFQGRARSAIAPIVGVPERQIIFAGPLSVAVWALVRRDAFPRPGQLQVGGVHGRFWNDSLRRMDTLLLINKGSDDFASLVTLAHEAAHAQQSDRAIRQAADPLVRSLVEGFQARQTHELIQRVASQNAPFAREVRAMVEERVSGKDKTARGVNQILSAIWGIQAPVSRSFDERLRHLLRYHQISYPQDERFVERLIRVVGVDPVRRVHQEGITRDLRDALGPRTFDALRALFTRWSQSPQLHGGGARTVESHDVMIDLAIAGILERTDYPRGWRTRLLEYVGQLDEAIQRISKTVTLHRVLDTMRHQALLDIEDPAEYRDAGDALVQLGTAYIAGTMPKAEIPRRLDTLLRPYGTFSTTGLEEQQAKAVAVDALVARFRVGQVKAAEWVRGFAAPNPQQFGVILHQVEGAATLATGLEEAGVPVVVVPRPEQDPRFFEGVAFAAGLEEARSLLAGRRVAQPMVLSTVPLNLPWATAYQAPTFSTAVGILQSLGFLPSLGPQPFLAAGMEEIRLEVEVQRYL